MVVPVSGRTKETVSFEIFTWLCDVAIDSVQAACCLYVAKTRKERVVQFMIPFWESLLFLFFDRCDDPEMCPMTIDIRAESFDCR